MKPSKAGIKHLMTSWKVLVIFLCHLLPILKPPPELFSTSFSFHLLFPLFLLFFVFTFLFFFCGQKRWKLISSQRALLSNAKKCHQTYGNANLTKDETRWNRFSFLKNYSDLDGRTFFGRHLMMKMTKSRRTDVFKHSYRIIFYFQLSKLSSKSAIWRWWDNKMRLVRFLIKSSFWSK